MPTSPYKRPSLADFKKLCDKFNGNKSNIAKALGVTRQSINSWCAKYPKYAEVIEEYRGRLLDKCLKSAEILALGIAETKRDPATGKEVIVGWKERPDSLMLRYLIGKLGANEGFGETVDITSKGESIKPEPITLRFVANREELEKIQAEVPDLQD